MKEYVDSFLELIYPEKNTCFVCDKYDEEIDQKYICCDCEKKIKKIVPPVCVKCSKPINYDKSTELCQECGGDERYFEISKSLYAYEGVIKNAIYNYKYYNKPYFYKLFGNLITDFINKENYLNYDYIVSVPLHRSKLRKRGYNQSELLARHISNSLSIPYIDALKRIKRTKKQSEKSKEERRKNLKDAFLIKASSDKIINRSVLLVDDIYTTGSTVNECSKALITYGVSKVYVITIAR
ncbi:ComF family protein [Sedimentibacter sp.]|uniref:ComF family protein n=1 Tax=Sedimentibacter sp. TaxID=1960295 RepID=UPI0028A99084|nr:ComF family protein [Sedimentibacter sp.]